ncbi:MAG: DUF4340 domain-containing protein [Chloroflexota bacterium]
MSGSRTTRLLLVVFVGILAVAYLLNLAQQSSRPQPTATPETQPDVFPGVEPTQITRIEIESVRVNRKITLVKVPGDWKGTDEKGASVPVDLAQVSRMLQVLSSLRYNRVMEGTADVKTFGFEGGGFFIVRFDAGQQYSLHIGDLNSAQTNAYIQRGDDPTVLQVPSDQIFILLLMISKSVNGVSAQ